jgi:hypothetical protein
MGLLAAEIQHQDPRIKSQVSDYRHGPGWNLGVMSGCFTALMARLDFQGWMEKEAIFG